MKELQSLRFAGLMGHRFAVVDVARDRVVAQVVTIEDARRHRNDCGEGHVIYEATRRGRRKHWRVVN